MSIFDQKHSAELAKTLMAMCVRNAEIENIHAGKSPMTKTGDYSDDEMKVLMTGAVNRLYTFFMQGDDPRFDKNMDCHKRFTREWDKPEIDKLLDCTKENQFSKNKD